MAIRDPASFTPVPFIMDGLALVHCDPHIDGTPWQYAPRVILKSLIAAASDAGFEPWVGAEVEYFLLTRGADGTLSTADTTDTAAQPCFDARGVTRMYDHQTAISTAMTTLGWSNYANNHEDGNGQFEQNFRFADALTTADRVITLAILLSMMAAERGMVATFMPKPFADRTGNGPAAAGLLGCGVMAGIGAVISTGAVNRDDTVAGIGCGGVGNAAIAGAALVGAKTIIAVDLDARKLAMTRERGRHREVDIRS